MSPLTRTLLVGLRVADRDASVAFYRALGYEIVGSVPDSPIGYLTMLKLPGDEFVTIELVADGSVVGPASESSLSHLVIATDSIDGAVACLASKGIEVRDTTPQGGPDEPRTSTVLDPDGNEIELVQWPAGHPVGMTAADFIVRGGEG